MKDNISISIDHDLLELLRSEAKKDSRSVSNYIEHLLKECFKEQRKKTTK